MLRNASGLRAVASWVALAMGAATTLSAAAPITAPPAAPRWELEFASGVLWKVGGGATPLPYVVLPQILSWRIPPIAERPLGGGTLVLRSRFSLLLEPIVRGPEDFYGGLAAAGDLEWRDRAGRFSTFFAAGGGFGWMNSKGQRVSGAQGQDFNLNWLIHAGARYRTREDWLFSFGLYFQHISNRGMNDVNPGLNSLGPVFGIARRF